MKSDENEDVTMVEAPRLSHLRRKRDEILQIAARHGAHDVRVFGSVARGREDADSDVDLLVRFAPGVTLLMHVALIRELSDLLGHRVDVVSERGLRPRVREQVTQEAIGL